LSTGRQLTFADVRPEQPLADPWTIERQRRPEARLLRVIDLVRDAQAFVDLREGLYKNLPLEPRAVSSRIDSRLSEGVTVIYRPLGSPPLEAHEFDEIVREYDDVWRSEHS